MAFNAEKFERAKFEARRAKVPVDALAEFFDEGETPEWEVRGLSAVELHKAIEASKRQGSIEAIVKAIAANQDQAGAVRKALGLTKDTPGEIAKRLEMLVMGSVSPKIELPAAVKLVDPAFKAVLVSTPGYGAFRRVFADGLSFDFVQTLS